MFTHGNKAANADVIKNLQEEVRFCRSEMQKVNAAMSECMRAAAHDLKAPLTRINYYCSLLKEDAGDKLDDECNGYIDRMQANIRRSQNLIDDLHSYSRTLHNDEEKSLIDLTGLVGRIVDDMASQVAETKARVIIGTLPEVPVYPMHMRQLFQNLIGNALKYKDPARDPVIHIDGKEDGDCYLLTVKDNGLGMEKKYYEKIFRPFERLHTQDQIEGSGLGLAAAQKIAELHRGKIWVNSTPGAGSTFFIALPKQKEETGYTR